MRLIVSHTSIESVCLVYWVKPFKIPFSISCSLYRDNERNKKIDLSCCKIQLGEIPRFRCPLQTAPVRTEGLFWRPHGCNIAEGNDPPSEAVAEVWHRFFENFSAADFSPHLRRASCTFVCRKNFRHTKGARSARPGGVPESRHLTTYDMTSSKKRIGRPTTTDPRVHRYNFKLTTEENIRFKQMLYKAGSEHNRSRFIVKRIFAEEFVVIKRDPSKTQFIARLNEFYFQFQKLANNCAPVKAI